MGMGLASGELAGSAAPAVNIQNSRGRIGINWRINSSPVIQHDKPRFYLLLDIRARDVNGAFVLNLAMGGKPALAAGEEIVELVRRHRLGKIGVPTHQHDSAKRIAFA